MGGLWRRIRQADHALLWLCEKFTQVVAVSVLWLLACVPLVTLVPATAALYYACMKAIRRDWGGLSAAFQTSFRENWKQGIGLSLVVLSLSGACLYPILAGTSGFAGALARVLFVWVLMWAFWLAIGLSRFSRSFWGQLRFAWSAMVSAIPRSIGLLLISLAVIFGGMLYWHLVLLLPGLWALAASLLAEPVLVRCMPTGDRPAWYWGADR